MFEVILESSFSSAHRLREYDGNCERMHGHNWRIEVAVARPDLDEMGMVIDFRDLKRHLKEIFADFDHYILNDRPPFTEINPTTENIAKYVFDELARRLPAPAHVRHVTAWETDGCGARYERD
ncbi:MAG TPA: 6-carboxytetrahydropterin synthase QueD [Candidatus Brocadiia bacterium]|nr:6-carboxytetrahydropterin synthase QueD [Candidatus Brocadiia bacterium]